MDLVKISTRKTVYWGVGELVGRQYAERMESRVLYTL